MIYTLKKITGFLCLALSLFSLSLAALASPTSNIAHVSTAEELTKALDNKKIEHIVITDDITGNFKIYRWLRSIRGERKGGFFSSKDKIKIRPQDPKKCVFETELETWFRKTPTLKISNLQIVCPGGGINSDFIGNHWLIEDCDFVEGSYGFDGSSDHEITQCRFRNLKVGVAGGRSNISKCSFEDVRVCVRSVYGQQIQDCNFNNCSTVLYLWDDEGPVSSIARSTVGEQGVNSWCIENRPDDDSDSQPVTIDVATLQSCRAVTWREPPEEVWQAAFGEKRNRFYRFLTDCIKNARQEDPFTTRNKDCEDSFRQSIRNKDFVWALQYACSEWDKYQQSMDKDNLEHLLVLYRQFVQLPILQILDGQELDRQALKKLVDGILEKIVPETYLCQDMTELFVRCDMQEPAMPFAVSPYIKLANTSPTLDLLAKIAEDSPQKTLRSSLDSYIAWVQLVKKYKTAMEQIKEQVRHLDGVDTDYAAAVQRSVMKSNEIFENVSRLTRALYFDLPTQAFFCSRYAQTWKAGKNKNAVERIVRSSVPFYKIYIKLCVFPSTNTLYQRYLLKKWKKVLGEENFQELISFTATDPDMISDNSRVEAFFRDYQ